MGLGSIIGGAVGGILQSNQNPFNSGFGSVTGGLFPAGINQFGDNFINGWMNYYWNKKAADDANDKMIDFWNMQNAYNHPKEQMKRFAEAGLNPNLIYGQSNVAGSIGRPAVASFNMPSNQVNSRGFDLLQALQAYYGLQNVRAQNSLIASQTAVADASARRMNYETKWLKDHGTSSFENSTVRAGKSLMDYAQPVADVVGDVVGRVVGSLFYNRPAEFVDRHLTNSYRDIRYRLMHSRG